MSTHVCLHLYGYVSHMVHMQLYMCTSTSTLSHDHTHKTQVATVST